VASGWESQLRIAVDAAIPLARVFPLVAAFYAHCESERASHTQLRIGREVLGGAWDALAEGRADLVLGAAGDPPAGGGYRYRVLAEVTNVFAVAPAHPLATAAEPLSEAVIARHLAVVAADSSRRLAPRTFGLLAGQPTLSLPDLDAKLAAQIAGLGCGFLPYPLAADAIASGRLVMRVVDTPRPLARAHLAWRNTKPGKALAWWIDAATGADWRYLAAAPGQPRARVAHGRRRAT
jgi:DNA-binding transcriptional LysR family regulator